MTEAVAAASVLRVKTEITVALMACGTFFMTALLTGVWKYRCMMSRPEHQAPVYVDIAHRAALLYTFASLVLAKFAELSPFSSAVNTAAVGGPIAFFALAIATYIQLGLSERTDNQFRERNFGTTWGMWLLIAGEIGGFGVLFVGFLTTVFGR